LAAAWDPVTGGADWSREGWCVAWEISGGTHRIRADRLRPHLRVVSRVQSNPPRFRRWPKVFDGKSLRATAAWRGLAGGEVGAGASGFHTIASRGFSGVAGSKEHALRGRRPARRRRRGVGVSAGALSGQEACDVRARARAWVRMHVGEIDTGLGLARIENGRRGGAQAGAMGGGGQDYRSWAQTRA
jgi:hypothetical protein